MLVRFFGPFIKLAEQEVAIDLKKPISIRELITMLASRYPGFAQYAGREHDVELFAHIMFVRSGAPLKSTDKIYNEDQINVLLPVTGGHRGETV
jgi:hypothetical protein